MIRFGKLGEALDRIVYDCSILGTKKCMKLRCAFIVDACKELCDHLFDVVVESLYIVGEVMILVISFGVYLCRLVVKKVVKWLS